MWLPCNHLDIRTPQGRPVRPWPRECPRRGVPNPLEAGAGSLVAKLAPAAPGRRGAAVGHQGAPHEPWARDVLACTYVITFTMASWKFTMVYLAT